jgi:hypothetical protein
MSNEIFDFNAFKDLSTHGFTNRQKVEYLEFIMRQMPESEGVGEEINRKGLKHHLCNGVYVRELFLPAGILIIGKVHKHAHLSYVASGDISIMTDKLERITGPYMFTSPAGIKRAVMPHTDTVWMTFHRTDKTSIEDIEDEAVYDSDLSWITALLQNEREKCLN